MLLNHLRNSYDNYNKTILVPNISSPMKLDANKDFENNQDNKHSNKDHYFYKKSKVLSTHDKVKELDRMVHSPSLINTLILKSKLVNASHY